MDNKIKVDNKFETNRINNINSILKHYTEPDIPDTIINKINKKFKRTVHYHFIRTEQLEMGMIIRTVDLNITKLNIPGIVVKIDETASKKFGKIGLYNPLKNIYWNINPDKSYIFFVEKYNDTEQKMAIYGLLKNLNNKYK